MSDGVEIMSGQQLAALQQQTAAEVDLQVATAKRFPRTLEKVRKDAITMATQTREIAESCMYALPRGGKTITGPSVRLAEILRSCWGNIRSQSRILSDDGEFITAQGTVWDMEKNVLEQRESRRRITTKEGKTYGASGIESTGAATAQIALRGATFGVIPKSIVDEVYRAARNVAVGNAKTLKERRDQMVTTFSKLGIGEDRILYKLDRESMDDVGLKDIETLIGLFNSLKEDDTIPEEVFPEIPDPNKDPEADKAPESPPEKSTAQTTTEAVQQQLDQDKPASAPKQEDSRTPEQVAADLTTDEPEAPELEYTVLMGEASSLGLERTQVAEMRKLCDLTSSKATHKQPRLQKFSDLLDKYKKENKA